MEALNPVQRRIHQAALRLFAEKGAEHVSISDLALEAGMARGTIYNNVESMEVLFESVAGRLSAEMHERVGKSFVAMPDPALRLANGIRLFVRRAHEEPQWGAFMHRYATSNTSLRELFISEPMADLMAGLSSGRYTFRQEQMTSIMSLTASTVLGAIFLVLGGHRTWRDAGADAAEFTLRALGIPLEEARTLANNTLPPLPPLA